MKSLSFILVVMLLNIGCVDNVHLPMVKYAKRSFSCL